MALQLMTAAETKQNSGSENIITLTDYLYKCYWCTIHWLCKQMHKFIKFKTTLLHDIFFICYLTLQYVSALAAGHLQGACKF